MLDITPYLDSRLNYLHAMKDDPEIKKPKGALITTTSKSMETTFGKFSSWSKLIRAIANVTRMLTTRCFKKPELTPADLQRAERAVIGLAQESSWSEEIKQLHKSSSLHKQSTIVKLTPVLDKDGLLRVGGRAKKSLALSDQEKHPLIIPKSSHISKLIVLHFHQKVHLLDYRS